jgi:soluble lytic murein transglycosylase-like protein
MSLATAIARVEELTAQIAPAAPATGGNPTPTTTSTTDSTAASFAQVLDAQTTSDAPLPAGAATYKPMIDRAARYWDVDPAMLTAVIEHESGFNPTAKSSAGAMGLMQLMPETARALGVTNAYDPAQNIWGGAHYLSTQIHRFGDPRLALAAYSAGGGAVERYHGIPPYAETQQFVGWVMNRTQQLQGGAG